jgi:hypothetical protein
MTTVSQPGIYALHEADGVVRYVGQAINLEKRLRGHRNANEKARYPVEQWAFTIGRDNLRHTVLERCSLEQLDEAERGWISNLGTYYREGEGFNQTRGGSIGTTGYVYTENQCQKLSDFQRRYFEAASAREKLSRAAQAKYQDPARRTATSRGVSLFFESLSDYERAVYRGKDPQLRHDVLHVGRGRKSSRCKICY